MIPIEKVIGGGQSGGDIAGAKFGVKNSIPVDINICKDFIPIGRKGFPDGIVSRISNVNVVTQKTGVAGLIERTEYNVKNSDFTIILLNRDIYKTKGSKLTVDYCQRHSKAYFLYDICVVGMTMLKFYNSHCFWKVIELTRQMGTKLTVNIAGPRDLDESRGVRALEKMLYGGEKDGKGIG